MLKKVWPIAVFVVLALLAIFISTRIAGDIREEDIYYSFVEGERITNLENPYARIHESDMLSNRKYATYFPLFYELSALTISLGLTRFPEWLQFWRIIFVAANLSIGFMVFFQFYKRNWDLLGLLAAGFWFFNGWTLYVTFVAHLDLLAVLPLLVAILLYRKYPALSLLTFGISLALKQIGVFAFPLFLIWELQRNKEKPLNQTVGALALMGAVPFLTAIPFLAMDATGFIKSVAFSVTRTSQQTLNAMDISRYLGLEPLFARIPLILVLLLVYVCAWRFELPKFLSIFLALLAFTEFNPVIFAQYLMWPMAVLPFVIYELYDAHTARLKTELISA